jgi:hypothetical protein
MRLTVAAADRRHFNNLSIKELDTVILVENAGSCHSVELVCRETAAGEQRRHNAETSLFP